MHLVIRGLMSIRDTRGVAQGFGEKENLFLASFSRTVFSARASVSLTCGSERDGTRD